MLGVFAEFETNLRRERQMEGIAKAKLRGIYRGRKPTIDREEVDSWFAASINAPLFRLCDPLHLAFTAKVGLKLSEDTQHIQEAFSGSG